MRECGLKGTAMLVDPQELVVKKGLREEEAGGQGSHIQVVVDVMMTMTAGASHVGEGRTRTTVPAVEVVVVFIKVGVRTTRMITFPNGTYGFRSVNFVFSRQNVSVLWIVNRARDNPCEESGTFDASGAFHGDDRPRSKDSEALRDGDGKRSNESEPHGSHNDRGF